jgi:phenylacetate-CoA ligase
MEFLDVDTNELVESGQAGNICITSLHRTLMPLIRYNLRDLGRIKHEGTSPLGSNFRRMDKFLGRSDQMVKIRGVNIYPMACLRAVRSDDRSTGEWICVATRHSTNGVLRDEMTVRIEVRNDGRSREGLQEHYERRLQTDLGIKVIVELVEEGNLPETNVGKEGKPQRLIDRRGETKVTPA